MIGPKRKKLSPVERKLNQRAMERELVRILNENFKEDCDMGKHKFKPGDRVVYRITDGGPGNTELEGWHGTVIYVDNTPALDVVLDALSERDMGGKVELLLPSETGITVMVNGAVVGHYYPEAMRVKFVG